MTMNHVFHILEAIRLASNFEFDFSETDSGFEVYFNTETELFEMGCCYIFEENGSINYSYDLQMVTPINSIDNVINAVWWMKEYNSEEDTTLECNIFDANLDLLLLPQ